MQEFRKGGGTLKYTSAPSKQLQKLTAKLLINIEWVGEDVIKAGVVILQVACIIWLCCKNSIHHILIVIHLVTSIATY